jgi:dipeptidyl aminopeptidase/acylaminoacyl peptidase
MESIRLVALACLITALAASAAQARKAVPLIPRQVIFGNPDRAGAQLSPDGKRISFLAPVKGVLNVWVGPAGKPQTAEPITNDTKRGIQIYFWAFTNRHIIYLQDKDGDENWRVYSVEVESKAVKDLTPLEGVQARIQEVSHLFPSEILVGLNNRNKQLHDLYRVNIETGESKLIFENNAYLGIMTDDHYIPRLAFTFSMKGELVAVRLKPDGSTEPLATIGPEDVMTTSPIGFDKEGKTLYLMDSRGRNTGALASLNLETMEERIIAEDPRSDIAGVTMHPTEKTLQAYATNYERREWHPLDKTVAADFEALKKVTDGDPEIASRTLDDSKWLVVYVVDNGPVRCYAYDRKTRKATFLFTSRPALEKAPLVKLHPVIIKSRDGLDLVSYLTLPRGAAPAGKLKPKQPLPLVLWIHGGPWSRDGWGYNPIHEWLANRGYAVLSVNYRGSTGFGKSFVNAGNQEWGRKMHDDVIDAMKWAVKEGIADPKRVAITGGSYGGYETLVGVTMTPEAFTCGVDLCGPANMATWLTHLPEYWIPILPLLKNRVGDLGTPEGQAMLQERSPLTYANRIVRPLLVGQGVNDPRVPQRESDQIVKAMQDHKIPVTYLLYSDEGHGFVRPENSISFWAVMEAFLAKHLGGRYEPIGNDFKGSTIKVLAGAEDVPGLEEAAKAPGE